MPLSLRVHERDKKNPSVISKFRPYVRLSKADEIPLFFQGGDCYYEDGAVVKDVPEWAKEQLDGLAKKTQSQIGYTKTTRSTKQTGSKD